MDATAALGADGQPVDAAEMAAHSNRECRVYVGNLSYDVRSENLIDFMRAGECCERRGGPVLRRGDDDVGSRSNGHEVRLAEMKRVACEHSCANRMEQAKLRQGAHAYDWLPLSFDALEHSTMAWMVVGPQNDQQSLPAPCRQR